MAPYTLPPSAVWFITGCSSGIGHALCAHLATHTTCRIVATARNPSSLSSLPSGPNILKLALDVTSESSIQSALAATLHAFGRIDILVNNAGYGLMADTETADPAAARALMDTNFWAAVRLTQLALPIFREENAKTGGPRGGMVMQITSLGGRLAFAGNAFYHASKFALEGFTEALAKEVPEEWGVRFLCVEPGGVKTRYAETSTGAFDVDRRNPAYRDPGLPTNVLLKYKESAEATRNWAEPGRVAEVLYGYVKKGGDMPLRLPLGSDSWGMQKKGLEEGLRDLESVRGVSLSTESEEQLRSIEFLQV
ncbi:short-chain dehydrogenase [Trematosphaeria pertusa]|uniref:Short-chain dehydrogenase n=1 Tax=Trematosphaeria pertusa TaxID=390896 RepID=A0A6A6HW59_9PLEO|nr:short-chain dehydrogenase [Trematosphaeria pertusa]KAF2241793.1 short-chain dehydrogenase [Trematosphaeria pertusa]